MRVFQSSFMVLRMCVSQCAARIPTFCFFQVFMYSHRYKLLRFRQTRQDIPNGKPGNAGGGDAQVTADCLLAPTCTAAERGGSFELPDAEGEVSVAACRSQRLLAVGCANRRLPLSLGEVTGVMVCALGCGGGLARVATPLVAAAVKVGGVGGPACVSSCCVVTARAGEACGLGRPAHRARAARRRRRRLIAAPCRSRLA